MEQPVPDVTDSDVTRVVRRDFQSDQVVAVMALLREYETAQWEGGHPRVLLATLKLAEGDLDSLRRQIDVAKTDYRDVLACAEYPQYMRSVPPGADGSGQEVQGVIQRDWTQYQNWLTETYPKIREQ